MSVQVFAEEIYSLAELAFAGIDGRGAQDAVNRQLTS
jgi:hypothetical protein